jgi:hypothetical protein
MTAQTVGQHRPLPDQKIPRLVQHQRPLLVDRLDGEEAHGRLGHGFADPLGARHVGLASLDVGLPTGQRHPPHDGAERRDLPRPMRSGPAGLHFDDT